MKTILDVVEEFREADPPLTYLGQDDPVAYGKFLEFEVMHWNGVTRIVPSEALHLPGRPGHRSFMYRGQTARYPTCEPSLLRGVPTDEWQIKARLTLERFRVAELELVLRDHPFKAVAGKRGFHVDYHGLAQHYGIPTSLLDLTSNVEVAAFFAVARWDQDAACFRPMETGSGVMYRFRSNGIFTSCFHCRMIVIYKVYLNCYAALHARTYGEAVEPVTLIPNFLKAFMVAARGFRKGNASRRAAKTISTRLSRLSSSPA